MTSWESFQAGINKVLIKVDPVITEHDGFVISDAFEPAYQASVTGTVVSPPLRLHYEKVSNDHHNYREIKLRSLPWDTRVSVERGDRVAFHYMMSHDPDVKYGEYILIDFEFLYFKNLENPVMLNGYLLVDPINDYSGTVKHAGEINHDYWDYDRMDDVYIEEGTRVYYDLGAGAPIEKDFLQSLNVGSNKSYYKVQRKNIIGYDI